MNKTKTILVIMLLLSFSLVSAYNVEKQQLDRTNNVPQSTIAKWYWNLLGRYANLIQERNELKARVEYLEANPITIRRGGSSSTTYITNNIYCDVLECRTNEKLVWNGFDENGCRMNQECIVVPAPNPNEPHAEIVPATR
jgi:hypothetical protein